MPIDDLAFYLLDIAVEFGISLEFFSRHPLRLGMDFNCRVPRHSRTELVAALLELQARGDILFLWGDQPIEAATAVELEAGILGAVPLSYELTPTGGDRWAAICNVDWRYWREYEGSFNLDTTTNVLTTGDLEWTEFWLEVDRRFDEVIPESVEWEEVRPWCPVKWHQEPLGWRVTYVTRERNPSKSGLPPCQRSPEPASPLAPRRVRPSPPVDRPFHNLTDHELERKGWLEDPRTRFAVEMESVAREDDVAALRRSLGFGSRQYAVTRKLAALRDAASVPALLRAVVSERDLAAAEALGDIGDDRCLAPLTMLFEYLKEPRRGALRDTIGRTLARFGDAGAAALLPFMDCTAGCQALLYSDSELALAELRRRAGEDDSDALQVLEEKGLLTRWRVYRPKPKLTPERLAQLEEWVSRRDWKSRYEFVVHVLNHHPEDARELRARLREDPDLLVRVCARFPDLIG